ncbi:hypothetical protein EDB85DRAFT_2145983 [Lactarius pseudohatsudake]|nr:hypothetical protein EDB85DRAFT_2145983 [Lactarius pseudohatsudake]
MSTAVDAYTLQTYGQFLKVMHTFSGLYMWEFFTTLDFEWEVYTGRRQWRWSFLVYVSARLLALACVITGLIGFNLTTEFNCNLWLRCVLVSAWFAACTASLLLVLRGIAIWGRQTWTVAITGVAWLSGFVAALYAITLGQAQWSPDFRTCNVLQTDSYKWSIMVNFIEDFILLVIMIWGVLRKRNATHLWNLLYLQGLFWVLTACLTELPSVALSFQNINEPWNLMFQYPHLTIMVITSSRAYRDLFQYITNDQDEFPGRSRRKQPRMHTIPVSGRDVQVTITKTIEFDVELHLQDDAPAVPSSRMSRSRMEDEVCRTDSPDLESREAQQIRSLELQMRQDLEI